MPKSAFRTISKDHHSPMESSERAAGHRSFLNDLRRMLRLTLPPLWLHYYTRLKYGCITQLEFPGEDGSRKMSDQHSFVPADRFDREQFTNPQAGERALNAAIVRAEISRSFEEYLEIFDAFYADDIEVSSDTGERAIWGKAEVRSVLLNFLVPLHIMAEVGELSISIREAAVP